MSSPEKTLAKAIAVLVAVVITLVCLLVFLKSDKAEKVEKVEKVEVPVKKERIVFVDRKTNNYSVYIVRIDGVEYVAMGGGGICPLVKEKVDE